MGRGFRIQPHCNCDRLIISLFGCQSSCRGRRSWGVASWMTAIWTKAVVASASATETHLVSNIEQHLCRARYGGLKEVSQCFPLSLWHMPKGTWLKIVLPACAGVTSCSFASSATACTSKVVPKLVRIQGLASLGIGIFLCVYVVRKLALIAS